MHVFHRIERTFHNLTMSNAQSNQFTNLIICNYTFASHLDLLSRCPQCKFICEHNSTVSLFVSFHCWIVKRPTDSGIASHSTCISFCQCRMQFDWTKQNCVRQLDVTFVVKHVMPCHFRLSQVSVCVCVRARVISVDAAIHALIFHILYSHCEPTRNRQDEMHMNRREKKDKKNGHSSPGNWTPIRINTVTQCATNWIDGDWNNCSRSHNRRHQTLLYFFFCF